MNAATVHASKKLPSSQKKAKCWNISDAQLVRRFRDLFKMGQTSALSDPEWTQHDICGEAHTNLQLYLYHITPWRSTQLTLTIILTFTFRILFWLLLVLCSHGCRLASRKRSSLESCPPSEGSSRHILDRMPGSRNDWSEPSSSLMIHLPFLPLWGCFRQSRLRKQLFPRKTRVEGGSPVGQLKTTEAASLKGAPTVEGID